MASFSNTAFSIGAFSTGAFDFGIGPPSPPASPAPTATPGIFRRSLRGMRSVVRGEDEDEKRKRREAMGIIGTPNPVLPPAPKKRPGPAKAIWKTRH